MKQRLQFRNKGQSLTTWAIGLVFVLIGGLTGNQYRISQEVSDTKSDIKVIKESMQRIEKVLDNVIEIKIKQSATQQSFPLKIKK